MNDNNRNDFIANLRELADFLEEHPGVPVPTVECVFNVFITREQLRSVAKAIGTSKKSVVDDWFFLRKQIGLLQMDFNVPREQVCVRRVVGTTFVEDKVIPAHEEEIVEWDCAPIMEVTHGQDSAD